MRWVKVTLWKWGYAIEAVTEVLDDVCLLQFYIHLCNQMVARKRQAVTNPWDQRIPCMTNTQKCVKNVDTKRVSQMEGLKPCPSSISEYGCIWSQGNSN